MVYNNQKGILECVGVNMPWTGGIEKDNLKDIAVLTGATLVDNEHMLTTPQVRLEHLGRAALIKVNEY
jgi:chaperonin GroEL